MNHKVRNLLQKNGLVTMKLAREFLMYNPGDRILTIADYSDQFETARGTVQSALNLLVDEKCVDLAKRGNQGSYVKSINYMGLWEFTGWGVIMGGALSSENQGMSLQTILDYVKKSFELKGFPYTHAFIDNIDTYIDALAKERLDFIFTSELAANSIIEQYPNLEISFKFTSCEFSKGSVLVFGKDKVKAIESGMKIGVDCQLLEQNSIGKLLCQKYNLELVPINADQVSDSILNGTVQFCLMDKEVAQKKQLIQQAIDIDSSITNDLDKIGVIISGINNFSIKRLLECLLPNELSKKDCQ